MNESAAAGTDARLWGKENDEEKMG